MGNTLVNQDGSCRDKKSSGSIVSFLILYVNDILLIGNDIPNLQSIETWLNNCLSVKDLREAVICWELSDLGGTQRQQNLKERSCTEAAPNEKTQNGAEKTSAEILGRGRKGNSIRPAIGSK
ncbi:hypothetical protein V6N13_003332 [Hibiscus sabdariffa]